VVGGLRTGSEDREPEAQAQETEIVPLEEETPEEEALTTGAALTAWIQSRPRAVILTLAVLVVPYLIICSGLAILLASGLAGGTCGG